MKLKKLKGIANNAVNVGTGCLHYPFGIISPPFEIKVDLLRGEMNPDMKGDDAEKFYKDISRWFHEVLQKEKIPVEVIEEAVILVGPTKKPNCIIKAKGKIYSSNS